MRRAVRGLIVMLSGTAVVGLVALAQDEKPGAPAGPTPTKEHRRLREDAGTWAAKVKFWMGGPEAKPEESEGVEINRILPGGLWLISDFRGEFGGMPFFGHGQFGYDTTKKKYVGTWIDSMTTSLLTLEGTHDEATKTVTWLGDSTDPSGKPVKMKEVSKYNDDGSHVMTMFMQSEETGNQMVKAMEISYERMGPDSPQREALKRFFPEKKKAEAAKRKFQPEKVKQG